MSANASPNVGSPPISRPADDGASEAPHLEAHLRDVARRAHDIVPEGIETPSGYPLTILVERLGWVHDIGKANPAFQARVQNLPPWTIPDHHSPLGALAAYHVLRETGAPPTDRLAGFLAVARHHGRLPDAKDYLLGGLQATTGPAQDPRFFDDVHRQLEAIDGYADDLADRVFDTASDGATGWAVFRQAVDEDALQERIVSDTASGVGPLVVTGSAHDLPPDLYEVALQAWSSLILADKTAAARAPRSALERSITPLSPLVEGIDALEADPASNTASTIHQLRRRARRTVLSNVDERSWKEARVATLTLPTGLGKTLTGLEAAHRIREAKPRDGPIVYALPYTSIIDQVGEEVRGIYEADPSDPQVTIHHHLSEASVRLETGTSEPTDRHARLERMLGTSWRTGIVVTTFVQLFESLAGPPNRQGLKLPALHDAVVILDEPQALPHRWWALTARLIDLLVDRYDASIVAMTATPPRIMEAFGRTPEPLVPDAEAYFEQLDRVGFHLDDSVIGFIETQSGALPHEAAADDIIEACDSDTATLAICNTISSARTLTAAIDERLPRVIRAGAVDAELLDSYPDPDPESPGKKLASELVDRSREQDTAPVAMHLTTRLRPSDRLRRIKAAKQLTEEKIPFLLVSTQLIEAGVDVSFDTVYRDLAPLPNLVQAAGRCNRSMDADTGTVTVWWLEAPSQGTSPAEAIYAHSGHNLLPPTAASLAFLLKDGEPPFPEPLVSKTAVDHYYDALHEKRPGSRKLASLVDDAQAASLGRESMIEERTSIEVLVVRTPQDLAQLEHLREAWASDDPRTAEALLHTARKHQVSIPIFDPDGSEARTLGQLPRAHPDADLRVLDATKPRFHSFLHAETGEVRIPESSTEARFL